MKNLIFFFLFVSILFTTSCNRGDEIIDQTPVKTPTGKVTGTVLSKNGTQPIGGALVFSFDDKNELYYTYSKADGTFILDAPEGQRTLHIQTGGGANFRSEVQINVKKNETISLSVSEGKLDQVATMAYVAGSYDQIQDIVTSLGYTVTQISFADLQNLNLLSQYDIIFLNCGSKTQSQADNLISSNLSSFVSNGGSIYASDWAVAYLVGGGSNTTMCSPAGGFIPDSKLCSINNGPTGNIAANVPNTSLASALGFSNLNINYNLGSWQKIVNYDPTYWDTMVSNAGSLEALMIKTDQYNDPNAPNLSVGTSANNNMITICHNPTGNNPVTITINQNAWPAHQAHGDSMGPCTNQNNNGKIFYTTFHNHANQNIGNSALILQYVILNL